MKPLPILTHPPEQHFAIHYPHTRLPFHCFSISITLHVSFIFNHTLSIQSQQLPATSATTLSCVKILLTPAFTFFLASLQLAETRSIQVQILEDLIDAMASWSTGLCDCCGQPGGCCLCVRASFCPCTILGDINERVGGPCGFIGGCFCGCLTEPCCLPYLATTVAQRANIDEGCLKAVCCSICCSICYMTQVYKETEVKNMKPNQQQMH